MLGQQGPGQGSYTYAATPRAVGSKKKYRDPLKEADVGPSTCNIMQDPRVIRGSNFSVLYGPSSKAAQAELAAKEAEAAAKRKRRQAKRAAAAQRPRTPEAVAGRAHIDVQTELYLEEITDRVPEAAVGTQTDAFLDRPASPLFVAPKSGINAETQIEEGELFDFDREVEPLLQVLVGKTLEQALMEVLQEEELSHLRARQREFQQLRAAELAETQRMEEGERRRHEEKLRRLKQERARISAEKAATEKVAARALARAYLSNLNTGVVDQLRQGGFLHDEVHRAVETDFVPTLMEKIMARVATVRTARQIADNVVHRALRSQVVAHRVVVRAAKREAWEKAEEARKEREAEEARVAAEKAAEQEKADALEALFVAVDGFDNNEEEATIERVEEAFNEVRGRVDAEEDADAFFETATDDHINAWERAHDILGL